jgi:multisubunit Na+/H+ antiporter MnhF subunit
MKPIGPEVVCFWIAAVLYGVAAIMQILAVLQKKKNLADMAMNVALLGLIAHSANFFLPAVRHNYTGL